jgi:iron complex outermembrane receptor protein
MSRQKAPQGRKAARSALGLLLSGAALIAGAGVASAQEQESEEIVVTGSRIRVDPLTQTQPVINVGQEEMARTGLSSTADILQRLPISGGGLNTKNNNSGNIGNPPNGGGVGAGSAEIDLHFLTPRRVLVLVDGLRWVNGTAGSGVPGSVDLNTIPASMIERIEVLQEGASPIYGSDAIAGVVNIITKTDQDGFQASGQIGQLYDDYSDGADGESQSYSASFGLSTDRTDIVVGADYANQARVNSADRALSAFPDPYATACTANCSSGTPNGRFVGAGFGGSVTLIEALAPGDIPTLADFRPFVSPVDRYNFAPSNYIQTPSERFGGFAQVTHQITDDLTLRLRASYVDRHSTNQAAPLPLFIGQAAGTGTNLDETEIDATNPFNPFGALDASNLVFLGRRMVEAGPRHFEQDVQTWNFTASLDGVLNAFGREWFWDANYVNSENTAEQNFTGNINVANVQQALGPVAACTAPCVPLNIFGGEGTITPAMLDFIGYTEENSSDQILHDFSFNITGDLFDLPAGPLAFAAGYEHRYNEGHFNPDPITAAGNSADIPALPSEGDFSVDEVYGELRIPLAKDDPFFYLLEASLAGRYFDYSTFGSDATYKAGVQWRPFEEILFRTSYGEGFRAPSIGELFGSPSRFDQTIIDPCRDLHGDVAEEDGGRGVGPDAPANVIANCVAHGVPDPDVNPPFVQFNNQMPVFTSGNENLQPETSESWNVGAVWRPSFLNDTLLLEVNYSDIKIDQAIQAKDSQAVIDLCAETGDPGACDTIVRASDGTVRSITNPLINVGGVEVRALDFGITWTSPDSPAGQFTIASNTSHLLEYTELVALGTVVAPRRLDGTERGSPAQGFPEWKSSLTLNWDLAGFGATVGGRYLSELLERDAHVIDAVTLWDAQVRFSPGDERFTFALGVNNIFDEATPGCTTCDVNNLDPTLYDVPGRFGYVRVAYRK